MKTLLSKFVRDEDGAALVEYGIALLVVILVGTGALIALSQRTDALFTGACTATNTSITTAGVALPTGTQAC